MCSGYYILERTLKSWEMCRKKQLECLFYETRLKQENGLFSMSHKTRSGSHPMKFNDPRENNERISHN